MNTQGSICWCKEDVFAPCYFLWGPMPYSSSDVLPIVHNMICWHQAVPEVGNHTYTTAKDVAICIPVSVSRIYSFLFTDSNFFFKYLEFTHYCKGNGSQVQLRNPAGEPVQPQNNRMSFVCTLMAVKQTKEKKAYSKHKNSCPKAETSLQFLFC